MSYVITVEIGDDRIKFIKERLAEIDINTGDLNVKKIVDELVALYEANFEGDIEGILEEGSWL